MRCCLLLGLLAFANGDEGVDGAYFEHTTALRGSNATARRLGAPPTAMAYKGIDWAPISVYGSGVKHIFAIGHLQVTSVESR